MFEETRASIESNLGFLSGHEIIQGFVITGLSFLVAWWLDRYVIAADEAAVCEDPPPKVRFRLFGPSTLDFDLLCRVDEPVLAGRVLDALNSAVYKRFQAMNIEIAYSRHDLYIKEVTVQDATVEHRPGGLPASA